MLFRCWRAPGMGGGCSYERTYPKCTEHISICVFMGHLSSDNCNHMWIICSDYFSKNLLLESWSSWKRSNLRVGLKKPSACLLRGATGFWGILEAAALPTCSALLCGGAPQLKGRAEERSWSGTLEVDDGSCLTGSSAGHCSPPDLDLLLWVWTCCNRTEGFFPPSCFRQKWGFFFTPGKHGVQLRLVFARF